MRINKVTSTNPLIEYFFFVESHDLSFEQRNIQFFPDGQNVIVLNFGDNFLEKEKVLPRNLISAICMDSHFVKTEKYQVNLVGIKLKAHGLYPYIDKPMEEIAAQIHSLDSLFGNNVHDLYERLLKQQERNKRIEILEDYFKTNIKKQLPTTFVNLITEINTKKGCISLKELTKKYKISERTIERNFKFYIGVNPKKYLRVVRFHAIAEEVKNKPKDSLTSLSYELNFSDQSHFIKDFYRFSQLKPSFFQKHQPDSDFYHFEY